MQEKMEDQDDNKPGIGDQGKRNPFEVPGGYFENFAERLQERMSVGLEPRRRKILRPAFIYIAGLFLFILIGYSVSRFMLAPRPLKLDSETRMANLVEYSLENIDEQTIIESIPNTFPDSSSTEITREEVLKYLQDQNIDPNSVKDEL